MTKRNNSCWLLFFRVVFIAVCVVGAHSTVSEAIDVSGRFGADMKFAEGLSPSLSRLDAQITFRAQDAYTTIRASVTNNGSLSYLGFADYRRFGPLAFQSFLVFNPSESSFTYFRNSTRFDLLGIGVDNAIYLTANQAQSYDQLSLNGVAGDVRWRAIARFDLCEVAFKTVSFRGDWRWEECGLDMSSSISFSGDLGMETFQLKATYPGIPFLTFGNLTTDFVLSIDYELEQKSISPQIRTRTTRSSFCLTPMLALNLGSEPLSIESLEVYGIELECSLGEDVEFYSATSFASTKNSALTGYANYFEVYQIRAKIPACCNTEGSIETAIYFADTSAWLFDVGMITASIDLPLSSKFRWTLELEIPVAADWVITTGWQVLF